MEPTVFFLAFDESHHELFVMRQTRGEDARTVSGTFQDHAPAAARQERLAHEYAERIGAKTCEFTTIQEWAQAEDSDHFQTRTCWLVQ